MTHSQTHSGPGPIPFGKKTCVSQWNLPTSAIKRPSLFTIGMTMGLQGDLVQPEPCVSLRISIALTDGSSPSFSELFFVKWTLMCWTEAAIFLLLGTLQNSQILLWIWYFRWHFVQRLPGSQPARKVWPENTIVLHYGKCRIQCLWNSPHPGSLAQCHCCVLQTRRHARFRWHSQSSCMSFTSIHVLLCQVCLDPQQSSQWIYEDQRFAAVPALHHPSWDTQLWRSRRLGSSSLPPYGAAAALNETTLSATTTV